MISVLYSIYGLSYFIMGFSILMAVPKKSRFRIASTLPLLGWFGILYGISEWISFFVKKNFFIEFFYFLLIISSFIFLYFFAIKLLSLEFKNRAFFPFLKYSFPVLWTLLFCSKAINMIDLSSVFYWGEFYGRFIFVFIAGVISFFSFWKEGNIFKQHHLYRFVSSTRFTGIGLLLNGIFSGIFYHPSAIYSGFFGSGFFKKGTGFPVEIIRVGVAVLITYFVIRLLKLFKWETEKMRDEYEDILREKERFFENIFSASGDAILVVNKEGIIEDVNERFSSITGFRKDELIRKKIKNFFYLYGESFFENIKEKEKDMPLREIEFYILNKKGDKIPVISGISVLEENRYLITCHDMREIQRLMGELRKININLESIVRSRTKELEDKNRELEEKISELERWQRLTVDRELKMMELKRRIKELKEKKK